MDEGRWPLAILAALFLLALGFWLGRHAGGASGRAAESVETGSLAAQRQARAEPSALTLWLWDPGHQQEYEARRGALESTAHVRLNLVQAEKDAHHDALARSFEAHAAVPDLAELEILRAGQFLAPPAGQTPPLLDLTDLLKAGGYLDRFPAGRWQPWTHDGRIYGIPQDIHPCVLLYRQDLYRQAGVDPQACNTWAEFVAAWQQARAAAQAAGKPLGFQPLFLSDTGSAQLLCLLYQAGADPFDGAGGVTLRSERAAEVLTFYRDLFTLQGLARPMAANGFKADLQTIRDGQGAGIIAPDWYLGIVEKECPELAGHWKVAPLPAWRAGGGRTSTWGGTMLGISRFSENPDAAWRLACAAYLDLTPEAAAARFRATRILAPDRRRWQDPVFHEKTPYFGGEPLGEILAVLADEVPAVQADARFGLLREVLNTAVYEVIRNGADPHAALVAAAERLEKSRSVKE